MQRLLLSLLPLVLAACASTTPAPAKDAAVAAADENMVCDRETRTGTILPTKRCRTAEQREADRRTVESVETGARNIRAGQTGKPGS